MSFTDPAFCSRIAAPLNVVTGLHRLASDIRAPADRTGLLATTTLLEGEVVGVDTGVGVPGMLAGPRGTGLNGRQQRGGRCDPGEQAYDLTVHGPQKHCTSLQAARWTPRGWPVAGAV